MIRDYQINISVMKTAGVDEAGRGALAGPVVAGAVILEGLSHPCLKDSKKLTELQREEAYAWIIENTDWSVAMVSSAEIDKIGIKKATEKAMNFAVEKLKNRPEKLMIDGRDGFKFSIESEDIVRGDEKVLEISAASIIAKVTRDRYMLKIAQKYPKFGFELHKGYGTKTHYELLDNGTFCEQHRKTYDPLKTWLNQGRLF